MRKRPRLGENKIRIYSENGILHSDIMIGNHWFDVYGDKTLTTKERLVERLRSMVFNSLNIKI